MMRTCTKHDFFLRGCRLFTISDNNNSGQRVPHLPTLRPSAFVYDSSTKTMFSASIGNNRLDLRESRLPMAERKQDSENQPDVLGGDGC